MENKQTKQSSKKVFAVDRMERKYLNKVRNLGIIAIMLWILQFMLIIIFTVAGTGKVGLTENGKWMEGKIIIFFVSIFAYFLSLFAFFFLLSNIKKIIIETNWANEKLKFKQQWFLKRIWWYPIAIFRIFNFAFTKVIERS